ncbi:MAG: metal-sulfur cluster assembly factor [Chitinophagaceae bacterium]|nr:metal-sulfur cluster assembly factor [Chitinophagaceae bacterium]MBK8310063.1 metal-sulfur cluster assembly factor [Chitinophagaceae bacterium]MBK8607124.1 metal-sulfur cluster assembly factor [Chitinophagaceae bacterium]MBP6476522.1 metal-sulfur cluster assembly factor [Chitinophagaceae bacterium]MBP7107425.1 metal-sulfur cluster assembly factor [Chitinophagaceae bacterium]
MNVISNNKLKSTIALAALQNVMDPEIGLNIVDLGLVYQIDFDESEKKIYCTMTLTTQFCPMGESITNAAKESLKLGFPEYEPNIKLTFDPPWNHEMISEAGQDFLNEM